MAAVPPQSPPHRKTSLSSDEKIAAISSSFDLKSKCLLFFGVFLVAYAYGLDGQTRYTYQTYATNDYAQHSLLGTFNTVRAICGAAIQPPYARVADRFGRLELILFATTFYVFGTILVAASNGVRMFVTGQLFYQIGYTGLMLLIEVLIADLTGLKDRVLFSYIPALPFIINTWVSGDLASAVLLHAGWRWGIGMWCIILPVCAAPVAGSVIYARYRAKREGKLVPKSVPNKRSFVESFIELTWELDVIGMILLAAMLSLVLLPLTLAAGTKDTWKSAHIIVMLVIGVVVCVPAFFIWEIKFAKYPAVPFDQFTNRTILAGMIVAVGLNMSWYLQGDFLYTVLAVSFDESVVSATRITSLYSFTSVLPFVVAGTLIFILAMGLLIKFRDGSAGTPGMIGAQIVLGFGGGLFPYPTQALVQAASSHEQMATMTALYLSFYQIGSALGNAISTAIWTQTLPKKLAQRLGDATAAASVYASPLTYIASHPVGTPERTAVIAAYSDVQRYLAITGLCLSLIVFVASLFLRNYKVDERQSLSEEERLGHKAPENTTA
ncbi:major facilitator superfamily transporter [Rhizoctonia solani]|uniref:Major facilitator superfamily transporter n=1 Tax=Rhizoctonia solani TaxID=456999 RepID=A0A8H8NTF9_9AGAM|nr:major facilitator superfamily transporter [Rhizoctonia solani]QRW19025.1 major facilitator superfamily transporter [Rhizoctonia solani]